VQQSEYKRVHGILSLCFNFGSTRVCWLYPGARPQPFPCCVHTAPCYSGDEMLRCCGRQAWDPHSSVLWLLVGFNSERCRQEIRGQQKRELGVLLPLPFQWTEILKCWFPFPSAVLLDPFWASPVSGQLPIQVGWQHPVCWLESALGRLAGSPSSAYSL
jgi:hypothetical protein